MTREEEHEARRNEMVKWVTEVCRKEIPDAGPWGLRIEIGVVIDWTGWSQLRTVLIKVWSIDRWVWWVSDDLNAIRWQYRQALMKRHYEDRRTNDPSRPPHPAPDRAGDRNVGPRARSLSLSGPQER